MRNWVVPRGPCPLSNESDLSLLSSLNISIYPIVILSPNSLAIMFASRSFRCAQPLKQVSIMLADDIFVVEIDCLSELPQVRRGGPQGR